VGYSRQWRPEYTLVSCRTGISATLIKSCSTIVGTRPIFNINVKKRGRRVLWVLSGVLLLSCTVFSSARALPAKVSGSTQAVQACTRAAEGSEVSEPIDLRGKNGVLKVSLVVRNSLDANGHMRYCYVDPHGNQAPTLRVQPGDTLVVALKNEISLPSATAADGSRTHDVMKHAASRKHDPCMGGEMNPAATNFHFHGLAIPPVCHEDETLKTLIEPGDPPFEYRVHIPKTQTPGLFWYHPHVHGFTEDQMLGGASGAIIVEGMERVVPRVSGLHERVLIVRDEKMPDASAAEKLNPKRPTKQISINNILVPYPKYPTPVIKMKPLERQFWRVLNASADTYLDLGIEYGGKRQSFGVVALDGVPLKYGEPGAENYAPQPTHIFLPPASRAEFVVTGPPPGVSGHLVTNAVFRGAEDDDMPVTTKSATQPALRVGLDDVDSARPLAEIVPSESDPAPVMQSATAAPQPALPPLSTVRPVKKRTLYFSEKLVDPSNPNSATLFFITEEGHAPAVFDPHSTEPTITVRSGDVEDWTIENRSRESHVFHIHQLHFIVVGGRFTRWEEPTLRDTIDVPAWDGLSKYPVLVLRMDFRDPRIVGTFPFHCHIMQHVDGGMMGTVQVEPPSSAADLH
jgi:FtsP/CotA-like multicopper oxidase with cupredoxin domain